MSTAQRTRPLPPWPQWAVQPCIGEAFWRLAVHLLAVGILYRLTFPGRHGWVWVCAVSYYWIFYSRMIEFALWTQNTLRLLHNVNRTSQPSLLAKSGRAWQWPRFVVLVPAYGAGKCIQTVTQVLNMQQYPRHLWRALFVTDLPECDRIASEGANSASDVIECVTKRRIPNTLALHEAAALLYSIDGGRAPALAYILVFSACGPAATEAWAKLLLRLEAAGLPDLTVSPNLRMELSQYVNRSREAAAAISAQLRTMLGFPAGAKNGDPTRHLLQPRLRISRVLLRALQSELPKHSRPQQMETTSQMVRSRLLGRPDLADRVRAAYQDLNPSTAAAIECELEALRAPNFAQVTRPPGTRNKAAALNFGLAEAEQRGWIDDSTYVMVLDSDSFLHTGALAATANELLRDPEPNVIRQLLPITTTNFNGTNWLVQSIIAADSIGSPGRWARSVRRQSRPDLTAGSGVVIPVAVLRFIRQVYGEAWDSRIICEDARMILSQYALLDGVRKKTKFVPSFVLEGAPEDKTLWSTYMAFWRQRIRWAIGGMDEVSSILRAPSKRLFVNSHDFRPYSPCSYERILAEARRLRLALAWLVDHIWWSGMILAPFLWPLAEFVCGRTHWLERTTAIALLVMVPGLMLCFVFLPYIGPLTPGGIRSRKLFQLFFCLLISDSARLCPVLVGQILWITGWRRFLAQRQWNPATPKPDLGGGLT
jgi:cellulose synthase/poly-beta-1,6-N-acetylglucosamine synthase-like glycosyltransferase